MSLAPPISESDRNETSLYKSTALFDQAKTLFPGGTTRITIEKHPVPIYIDRGEGAWLIDVDGNRYLDLGNNYTTLIHGHGFQPVIEAVTKQLRQGSCFANPTAHEIKLASIIRERVPAVGKLRFVNTGTEAVMFAIKAARAHTGRVKIAKFEGAYHGAYDWAEISQNSGPENWDGDRPASVPVSTATPQSVLDEVVVLPANDIQKTARLFEEHGRELACVLIDLMSSRPGLVPFEPDYLTELRRLADLYGALIVDDEVLNFRLAYEGAARYFDFRPDLFTFGKIIGGGLPIGAVGGPADIMRVFDNSAATPAVSQGGTFSANPLSIVAGIASMQALDRQTFQRLATLGDRVRDGLARIIVKHNAPFSVTGLGSLFRIHPKSKAPETYRDAYQNNVETQLMRTVVRHMIDKGILMPTGAASSLSTPMTEAEVDFIVECFDQALSAIIPDEIKMAEVI